MDYVVVFFGGGVGAALRHAVNVAALRLFGGAFPVGTFTVNVVGSLVMGGLAGYFALRGDPLPGVRLLLTTGLLGGFTTFSAFSLDIVTLFERGEAAQAAGYVVLSVGFSVAALIAGLAFARALP